MMAPTLQAPAPWSLTGHGLVLLYRFPPDFIKEYGFLAAYQRRAYRGWLGAVMFNYYQTSHVGPYFELLFIPGLFRFRGRLAFSVSKIYVSSYDSVWNARRNWAIPKELADFKVTPMPDGSHLVQVSQQDQVFFRVQYKPWGWPFPFTTRLVPLNRLVQQAPGHLLLTKPGASGKAQLCSLKNTFADFNYFPPVNKVKPLVAFALPNFKMVFPVPQILPDSE